MNPVRTSFLALLLCFGQATTALPQSTTPHDDPFTAARARFEAGDHRGAVRSLEGILETKPEDPQATLFLGVALVSLAEDAARAGSPQGVVETSARRGLALLEKAEAMLAPAPIQAWIEHTIGFGYLLTGESRTAKERFSRAIAKDPKASRDYLLRARIELQEGDAGSQDRAEKDLASAVLHAPADLVPRSEYAELLARRGRGMDAMRTLRDYVTLLRDEPVDARILSALHQIAEHALRLFDLASSRQALQQALPLAPGNPDLRLRLAEVLYRLEDFDAATRELDWLLARPQSLSPKLRREAHYFRGLVAKHRGDFALARTHLEETVRAAPWHAAGLQNLGSVLLRMGEREAGRAMLLRSRDASTATAQIDQLQLRLREGSGYDREAYFALAEELLKIGDRAEAGEVIAIMRDRLPHDRAVAALERRLTR